MTGSPFDFETSGMKPLRQVVFSLGSNIDDRLGYLQAGFDSLRATPDVIVTAVSGVYETVAVGEPQPDFLNIVVVGDTTLASIVLLERALAIEEALGRPAVHTSGPRTIDVDLVTVGTRVLHRDRLTLPHPRAHERAFVLVPWLEIDPQAALPIHGPVQDLIAGVDTTGVQLTDLVVQL